MKNKELIKIHKVENTPFNIIEDEKGNRIVMGNNLMSERTFKNRDEAEKYIYNKPWELITPAIGIIAEAVFNDLTNKQ